MKRAMILPGVVIILFAAGFFYQGIAARSDPEEFLGEMLSCGGYNINTRITGERPQGEAAVVLVPGLGDGLVVWHRVQDALSAGHGVLSYDPSGTGLSTARKGGRTSEDMAKELHEILTAAGVGPPYVLAGHSNGGFTIRMFRSLYPDEVAGLVFVDATHEDMVAGGVAGVFNGISGALTGAAGFMNSFGLPRLLVALFGPQVITDEIELPGPLERQYLQGYYRSQNYYAMAGQYFNMQKSVRQIMDSRAPLGSLPVAVLYSIVGVEEDAEELAARYGALAALSDDSTVRLVGNARHHIQLDQPQQVIEAITEVLDKAAGRQMPGP